jgi:hypothetical protein
MTVRIPIMLTAWRARRLFEQRDVSPTMQDETAARGFVRSYFTLRAVNVSPPA